MLLSLKFWVFNFSIFCLILLDGGVNELTTGYLDAVLNVDGVGCWVLAKREGGEFKFLKIVLHFVI